MNLVPLFFSALLLIALYVLASKFFPEARLLFFLLLTLNYPLMIFSRINDQIMPMVFFVIPAIYFFLKAWDRPSCFFLTSIFLGLSFLSKPKMIYFHAGVIPLAFLLITVQRGELRNIRLLLVRIGYALAGVFLVAVPWYIFIFSRYPAPFHAIVTLNSEVALPGNVGQAVSNWLRKTPFSFYPTNRLLTFALFFVLLALLIALFDKKRKASFAPLEIVCALWLLIGLGINSFIGYRPIRHYIEYTIPMIILVSLFLVRLAAGSRLDFALKKRGLFFAAFWALIWIGLTSYARYFFTHEDMTLHTDKVFYLSWPLALAAAAFLYLLWTKRLPPGGFVIPKKVAGFAAAVFVMVYAAQNIGAYARWVSAPTYNLKSIGRDLGKAFPQGVFSGLLIPSLSLENRNKAHTFYPDYANDDPGFLKREGVTHLFVGEFNAEQEKYEKVFPEEMERARPLVRYRLWRSWFFLYDLGDGTGPASKPFSYEAETLERETGIPLFDPRASGQFSVRVELGKPSVIGYRSIVLPGHAKFHGRLVIKAEGRGGPNPVLLIRIMKKGIIQFQKKMFIPPDGPGGGYQVLPFEGLFPSEGRYILDIKASGKGVLYFDKVEFELSEDVPGK
jgi:4-amino-4-deoxy-L-arabinose transferase-like glycosyltransferase